MTRTKGEGEQIPRSSRRNLLPMKRINGSLLMGHEHLTRAVVELMQVRQTPSGANRVLHHAPKAFDGVEVVPTMGGEEMEAKLVMLVVEGRIELVCPVDPAPVDDHDHCLPGCPEGCPHLME